MDSQDKVWLTSFEYIKALLKLKREKGFWMTGNQSWNLMKWNAHGNVLISERAINEFLKNIELDKSSKARDLGGRAGARCFVAEHVCPTNVLQRLLLEKYKDQDPSFEDLKEFFQQYNRICYVWHTEDVTLSVNGLKQEVPYLGGVCARYYYVQIVALPTRFSNGAALFKYLRQCRTGRRDCQLIREGLNAADH